ncbi:MAG: hypothetical protein N2652_03280 [Kiritimatiellae bacterium]|nr:hypothetical protein [Kiritimatiellia bacterium]
MPPLSPEGIELRDLSDTAQTINPQGVTIVPLEVRARKRRRVDSRKAIRVPHPGPNGTAAALADG